MEHAEGPPTSCDVTTSQNRNLRQPSGHVPVTIALNVMNEERQTCGCEEQRVEEEKGNVAASHPTLHQMRGGWLV
ncbi:hypothetical protein E2C01_027391 [Portunus trituberculatus]|uniref:Uncharacterized protein n=1 Tax=Portunus trituberculatus TaxID=210409 RepID=A0A5B7ELI1_PORTR|nr:hypothetical protein [Portunus trituberculatus]